MKKNIIILTVFFICNIYAEEIKPSFKLTEIAPGFGFASGNLRGQTPDYRAVPLFIHLGFLLNDVWGFPNHPGKLNFALEPFCNRIVSPSHNIELGFSVFFQYVYPILEKMRVYGEIGAGPMYLGIDTVAQGQAGFNFLDQVGVGMQFYTTKLQALNIGYRYRHISHAGIRGKPNKGIDSNAMIVSYSVFL